MKLESSRLILKNIQISNFMTIHPLDAESCDRTERETDRHDGANGRFSQMCERALEVQQNCCAVGRVPTEQKNLLLPLY